MFHLRWLASLVAGLCLLAGCGPRGGPFPRAVGGSIDLRNWDFERRGTVRLDGEWEWYWHELLEPSQQPIEGKKARRFFAVPAVWNEKVIGGQTLSGQGFATFRLRALLVPGKHYALMLHFCSSAFRLFLNQHELAISGVPGKTSEETITECRNLTPFFDATQAENVFTLQVANFHHNRGGVRSSLHLGLPGQILHLRDLQIVLDSILFSGLFVIMLYSLTSYFMRRKDPSALYLGMFCCVCGMWGGMQGASICMILFPGASWETLTRIEYFALYLGPPGFAMLIRSNYPREAPRWLFESFAVFFFGMALCVLILPPLLFTRLFGLASAVAIPFSVGCIVVAVRVAARKQAESTLFLIGFVPVLLGVMLDSVSALWPQSFAYVTPFALMGLVLTQALVLSRRSVHAQAVIEEQALMLVRLNAAYYRFVPKEFLRLLGKEDILSVRLGDQVQREMTVMFVDVRGFTSLSERMSPQENFAFVNCLLGSLGPLIREHHGFIDKYLGDGIMALFPDRPDDAVRATLSMRDELDRINRGRAFRGEPQIRIGIGIHTGISMLGTVGEPGRMDGTVISDAVNTASRLESLSKVYGAGVIVSEQVVAALAPDLRSSIRVLGRVRAKGKEKAMTVYEYFASDSEAVAAHKRQTRQRFEVGLDCYQHGDFATAASEFAAVREQNPADTAAGYYHRRSTELLALKGAESGAHSGWDGIEVISEK